MADSEIKVTVSNYGRKYLYMRYKDPTTGKNVAKSTGKTTMKEAVKEAGKWEDELRTGRYKPLSKVTWAEFRQRYEDERLPALAVNTAIKVASLFNILEELTPVDRLAKLDATQLSKFQRLLRDERKMTEASIKGLLGHLMAALNWAKKVKLLNNVPEIEIPRRAKGSKLSKGRAISGEEFERILEKVPEVMNREGGRGNAAGVERMRRFLRGLWLSGLRLGEAIDLSWDIPGAIQIDLMGKRPMLLIPGDKQKSGQDQILPLAPEFAEMVLATPEAERTGRVFLLGIRKPKAKPSTLQVSFLISQIGKAAGVVVNPHPKKFASAHDFRRSFGERWSSRVMPPILQQMMRHADINTTMKYYVGQNAQKAADVIYEAFAARSDKSCNTSTSTSQTDQEPATKKTTQRQ